MQKVDKTVQKETAYIAVFTLVLSVLMQAVFLVLRKWDYTVLLGNLLSGGAAILNFFLMGLTVQSAVMDDEKKAKNRMKLSQSGRLLLLFGAAAVGVLAPCFHNIAVLIPLFFPRIAVAFRPLIDKRRKQEQQQTEVK